MRPMVLLLTTAALVAALAWVVDRRSRPVAREVAPLAGRAPNAVIYAAGRIEGTDEPTRLRAELVGRVVEVLVREGEKVAVGQALVELDDELLRAELAEAEAHAAVATARLARLVNGARQEELDAAYQRYQAAVSLARQRKARWQRLRALWEREGARAQEVEEEQYAYLTAAAEAAAAEANYRLLKAGARIEDRQIAESLVVAAQARVRRLRSQLRKLVIRAPMAAEVLEVNCRVGELIGPESPVPAIVLVDRSQTHVRAFVEEFDAARVQIGQRAAITVDGLPERRWQGHVVRLSPVVQRKTLFTFEPAERYDVRVREVWIALSEPVELPVGLRVHVRIHPQRPELAESRLPPRRRSLAQLEKPVTK